MAARLIGKALAWWTARRIRRPRWLAQRERIAGYAGVCGGAARWATEQARGAVSLAAGDLLEGEWRRYAAAAILDGHAHVGRDAPLAEAVPVAVAVTNGVGVADATGEPRCALALAGGDRALVGAAADGTENQYQRQGMRQHGWKYCERNIALSRTVLLFARWLAVVSGGWWWVGAFRRRGCGR